MSNGKTEDTYKQIVRLYPSLQGAEGPAWFAAGRAHVLESLAASFDVAAEEMRRDCGVGPSDRERTWEEAARMAREMAEDVKAGRR